MTDAALPTLRRAAIFGGSFDPVHRGHLAMASLAREAAGLESVVFVPAAVSPFKRGTVAGADERKAMLEIALADEAMDWASVSEVELDRPGPSYSWETAASFQASEPSVEWHWILGTDQWEQIDRWAEPGRLRAALRFLVFTRAGTAVAARPGWRYREIPFDHPASSTAIRNDFEAHRSWLTPGVADYARARDLYP